MSRNGLDADRPLSSANYKTWRDSLADKIETVEKTTVSTDVNALKLTTAVNAERRDGEITRASLTVRSGDFHAVSQSIEFRGGDETHAIDIAELDFRVVSRETLAKDFFNSSGVTVSRITSQVSAPHPATSEDEPLLSEPAVVPGGSTAANGQPPTANSSAVTLDTEVEVMKALAARVRRLDPNAAN